MIASLYAGAALVILMLLGIPIALAMGFVGVVGFGLLVGWHPALAMSGQIVLDNILNYNYSILPLFVLMGNLVSHARLSDDMYAASNAFLGHRRGGLAIATIIASGGFSAVCGSSMATAATMGKVALPSMRRYGYDDGFAAASVAAGGTLGILIPPSVLMIIYGFMTNADVGRLFIAGIVPGLIGIALYCGAIAFTTFMNPSVGPCAERFGWDVRLRALSRVWKLVVLFLLVLGGIYLGIFTPNEAAGIGATGALLIALLQGGLTLVGLARVLVDTAKTAAMMFAVLFGALLFSNFLSISGGAAALSRFVGGLNVSPLVVLLTIGLIYLLLGCLLESLSMLLLTVPIFAPIVQGLGVDMVWFGIFVVVAIEMSLITPPVGLNVFVLQAVVPDVSVARVFRAIVPFFVADLIRLLLLMMAPGIALFLPALMR